MKIITIIFLAFVLVLIPIMGVSCDSDDDDDTTSPVITEVTISDITETSVTISWITDVPSNSHVLMEYHLYGEIGGSKKIGTSDLVSNHSITLSISDLAPNTIYTYSVESTDEFGNKSVSADHTFTTLGDTDTSPPIITSVSVSNITSVGVDINWNTNESAAMSTVEYGTTTDYHGNIGGGNIPSLTHSILLHDLDPNTTYHYRVSSSDPSGNRSLSDDQTFTTMKSGTSRELSVHFIDVGQGDAILIDKGETEVLIDSGDTSPGVTGYLSSYVDGDIEVMIATHMHADHIGGLIEVLNTFNVDEIWHNGDTGTSQTYTDFMTAVNAEGAQVHVARSGDIITADGLTLNVVNPKSTSGTSNNNSIVLCFPYGDTNFLFTGDAEQEAEENMLLQITSLMQDVDILKVGNHGSNSSTSTSFLSLNRPRVAIYMAGIDNTYGYPNKEIILSLDNIGATIYGTDVHGTIIVTTDGVTYDVQPTNAVDPVTPLQAELWCGKSNKRKHLIATLAPASEFIPNFRNTAHAKVEYQYEIKLLPEYLVPIAQS